MPPTGVYKRSKELNRKNSERIKKLYADGRVLRKAHKNKPEVTVLDKWTNDDMITKGLQKQNYKVLRFWEYDILNNPEIFRQKIIKIIKESRR